ncbi:MAG: hypothetical protein CV090_02725 [Nitrospira sp. WS238]|nr:hypothetical protein [Nitrospira sp. WS238]
MRKAATSSVQTVLMIEDHDDTACLVRFILERNGYAVRHAPDGKNAKQLTESSEPPDLVLLNISLPSLSSFEVLRAIRSTAGLGTDSGRHADGQRPPRIDSRGDHLRSHGIFKETLHTGTPTTDGRLVHAETNQATRT